MNCPTRVVLFTLGVSLFFAGSAGACFVVGDLNGDCLVGIGDLLLVADQWLSPGMCSEQGLVGHWKLDEETGAVAADSSGNDRHGVVFGGALWNPEGGKTGGTLQFDGTDDYVAISGYKGILGSNARTCTAWIKTVDAYYSIMSWGNDSAGGSWYIALNNSSAIGNIGALRLTVLGGNIYGTTDLRDGLWHHVAVVLLDDGSADVSEAVLYVDGDVEAISHSTACAIDTGNTDVIAETSDVLIGRFYRPGSELYFKGMIDNVCIYDRVLSDAEIAMLGESDDYWEDKCYWRPSAQMGGSPGEDDTDIIPELGSIVINEILAYPYAPYPDWIELYNATADQTIDIGGWFLSDSKDNYMKYRIPDNTILGPGEYNVFLEMFDFDSFGLSRNGDEVYLRSGLDGNGDITGYYEEEIFGASPPNVSLGRYQKSTGAFNFVAMSAQTDGYANAYPKVGPVVISEIMYHPAAGGTFYKEEYEYVELYNATNSTVRLYEPDVDVGQYIPWKFTDGIEYTFPLDTEIAAYGYLLVVKNPAAFAERHGSPVGVVVLGPYDKNLNNDGEKLEMSMPGGTDEEGRHYIRIDRVVYDDAGDWPSTPDGDGMSLTRINKTDYGNDPINWQAATASPGE